MLAPRAYLARDGQREIPVVSRWARAENRVWGKIPYAGGDEGRKPCWIRVCDPREGGAWRGKKFTNMRPILSDGLIRLGCRQISQIILDR
jgi:hypothetical protein